MTVFNIRRCLSASALAIVYKNTLTSSSNFSHPHLGFHRDHLNLCLITRDWGTGSREYWALWGDIWLYLSCISPGWDSVPCIWFYLLKYFILVWWILRPLRILYSFPQKHFDLAVLWMRFIEKQNVRPDRDFLSPHTNSQDRLVCGFLVWLVAFSEEDIWCANPNPPFSHLCELQAVSICRPNNFMFVIWSVSKCHWLIHNYKLSRTSVRLPRPHQQWCWTGILTRFGFNLQHSPSLRLPYWWWSNTNIWLCQQQWGEY